MTFTTSLVSDIPCKYLVVKYVENKIKDEPMNVGIILQSQKSHEIFTKFVGDFSRIRSGHLNKPQRIILDSLIDELKDSIDMLDKNEKTLESIVKNNQDGLRFTDIRGALASNVQNELEYLYDEYMNVSTEQPYTISTARIINEALNHLHKELYEYEIRKEFHVKGKMSNFVFDLMIKGNKPKYIHAISFDERGALDKTKLFDWSAKDSIIEDDNLSNEDFVPILAQPSTNLHTYNSVIERYEDGVNILTAGGYPIVNYDTGNTWKERLKKWLK